MSGRLTPKVQINLTAPGRGTVIVDGTEIKSVVGLSLEVEGHKGTLVTLRLCADEVSVSADEAEVIASYLEPAPSVDPAGG